MNGFPQSRGQRRAFNYLLALYRQGLPRVREPTPRFEDRRVVCGLISRHGRFRAVREALLARQQGSTVVKKYCPACGTATDHRGDVCCSSGQHIVKSCESCEKMTARDRRTNRCLEPSHEELPQHFCYGCNVYRRFTKQGNCQTCGADRSYRPASRSWWNY